jgi:hypothetical protein
VARAGVPDGGEVAADSQKLRAGHLHHSAILGVWDAQVLAVDVHELELEVADLVLV